MAKKGKAGDGRKIIATNKNARRLYAINEKFEAGLVLTGSEVKSIRAGKVNLADSYVAVKKRELFLRNAHINPYTHGGYANHEPLRERKLLMNRIEIDRLIAAVQQKGLSLVPMNMYFKKGHIKLEIGLGKGKKLHDKREDIKERDAKRSIDRAMKR